MKRKLGGKIPFFIVTALFLSSCGQLDMLNPYKKHEAKCKINCSDSSAVVATPTPVPTPSARDLPRSTAETSTDLNFWFSTFTQNAPRLATWSDKDTAALVTNPPLFDADDRIGPLSHFTDIFNQLTKYEALKNNAQSKNESNTCVINAFSTKAVTSDNYTTVKADFGKCIPLNALTDQDSASGAINVALEFERAAEIMVNKHAAFNDFWEAKNYLKWPFQLDTVLGNDNTYSLFYSTSLSYTSAQVVNNQATSAAKGYQYFSLGESKDKPFSLNYQKDTGLLTINGSLVYLLVSIQNPQALDDFQGKYREGEVVTVTFHDFAVSNVDATATFPLQLTEKNLLTGNYRMEINGLPFVITGKSASCLADLQIITVKADGSETAILNDKPLDLCSKTH